MTTRKTHTCNLCHDSIMDGSGVGLVWGIGGAIRFTVPSSAETHICQTCLNAIEDAHKDQRSHAQAKADAA